MAPPTAPLRTMCVTAKTADALARSRFARGGGRARRAATRRRRARHESSRYAQVDCRRWLRARRARGATMTGGRTRPRTVAHALRGGIAATRGTARARAQWAAARRRRPSALARSQWRRSAATAGARRSSSATPARERSERRRECRRSALEFFSSERRRRRSASVRVSMPRRDGGLLDDVLLRLHDHLLLARAAEHTGHCWAAR